MPTSRRWRSTGAPSCGGCEEAVVDLAEDILDVVAAVDIVFWPVALDFKRKDVEAMADGSIAAAFINGAIRTTEQEEMAQLLRRKSKLVVAFGACAQLGGIPGLANLSDRESDLRVRLPRGARPSTNRRTPVPRRTIVTAEGRTVTLPEFYDTVRTLDQVDRRGLLPAGLPADAGAHRAGASRRSSSGKLPPKGTVLAPRQGALRRVPAQGRRSPRSSLSTAFKRVRTRSCPTRRSACSRKGIVCMGPATRGGCEALCINGNMPCTRLLRPARPGAATRGPRSSRRSRPSSTRTTRTSIDALVETIPDPVGHLLPVQPARVAACSAAERMDEHERRCTRMTARRITIDPITRLEGHGRSRSSWTTTATSSAPTSRCPSCAASRSSPSGRPAEDMPRITPRICGVCPTAHHMASTKALDELYQVEPPPAAKKIRELVYSAFMSRTTRSTSTSWAGPDFVVGPDGARGRAQHPRRHRQGRPRGRQAGHRHAARAARADQPSSAAR